MPRSQAHSVGSRLVFIARLMKMPDISVRSTHLEKMYPLRLKRTKKGNTGLTLNSRDAFNSRQPSARFAFSHQHTSLSVISGHLDDLFEGLTLSTIRRLFEKERTVGRRKLIADCRLLIAILWFPLLLFSAICRSAGISGTLTQYKETRGNSYPATWGIQSETDCKDRVLY